MLTQDMSLSDTQTEQLRELKQSENHEQDQAKAALSLEYAQESAAQPWAKTVEKAEHFVDQKIDLMKIKDNLKEPLKKFIHAIFEFGSNPGKLNAVVKELGKKSEELHEVVKLADKLLSPALYISLATNADNEKPNEQLVTITPRRYWKENPFHHEYRMTGELADWKLDMDRVNIPVNTNNPAFRSHQYKIGGIHMDVRKDTSNYSKKDTPENFLKDKIRRIVEQHSKIQ